MTPYPQEGYFLRFYFWLDLLSTGTMVLDLVWVSDLMSIGQASNATNVIQIARAGRVSKLGARTARFIRIIRLMRMLRLYKNASVAMTSDQENKRVSLVKGAEPGRRVSEVGIHRVVIQEDCMKEDCIIEEEVRPPREECIQVEQPTMEKWEFDKPELKRNKFKLPPIKRPQKVELEEFDKSPKAAADKPPQPPQPAPDFQPSENSQKKVDDQEDLSYEGPADTKVGNRLKDEIQKNIILMVLLVLLSIPMFTSDTWIEQATVYNRGINQLQ